jgi:hypothetical protein
MRGSLRVARGLLDRAENRFGVRVETLAGRRQRDAAGTALDQRDAEIRSTAVATD